MSSNPYEVELGMHSTSVLSCTWIKIHIYGSMWCIRKLCNRTQRCDWSLVVKSDLNMLNLSPAFSWQPEWTVSRSSHRQPSQYPLCLYRLIRLDQTLSSDSVRLYKLIRPTSYWSNWYNNPLTHTSWSSVPMETWTRQSSKVWERRHYTHQRAASLVPRRTERENRMVSKVTRQYDGSSDTSHDFRVC